MGVINNQEVIANLITKKISLKNNSLIGRAIIIYKI